MVPFKAVDKYGVGLTRSGRSMDGLNPSILLPDLVTPTPYLLGWGGWLGRGKGRGSLRCPWVLHLYLLIDVSSCMYIVHVCRAVTGGRQERPMARCISDVSRHRRRKSSGTNTHLHCRLSGRPVLDLQGGCNRPCRRHS